MTVRLKEGVSLDNVHPRVFFAIHFAAMIWEKYGSPNLWITGANESGHATNPDPKRQFHRLPDGSCQAVDLRTWTIPELASRHAVAEELATALGRFYDVLYEKPGERGEHIHLQYDPERPGTVTA